MAIDSAGSVLSRGLTGFKSHVKNLHIVNIFSILPEMILPGDGGTVHVPIRMRAGTGAFLSRGAVGRVVAWFRDSGL